MTEEEEKSEETGRGAPRTAAPAEERTRPRRPGRAWPKRPPGRGGPGRGARRRGGPRQPKRLPPRRLRPRPPRPAAPAEDAEPEEVLTPEADSQAGPLAAHRRGEARARRRGARRRARRRRARPPPPRAAARAPARAPSPARRGDATAERVKGAKKVRQGTVVSNKADKTITVRIEVVRRHPQYEKIVRQTATIHAHDEANDANEGDVVRVIESRPLSRTKHWRLVEVLERAR